MPKITTIPGANENEIQVFIDDEILPEKPSITGELAAKSSQSFNLLAKCKLEEVFEVFIFLHFYGDEIEFLGGKSQLFQCHNVDEFIFSKSFTGQNDQYKITCGLSINPFTWKEIWSINEFMSLFTMTYLNMQSSLFSPFDQKYDDPFLGDNGEKQFLFEAFINHDAYSLALKDVLNSFIDFLVEVDSLTWSGLHSRAKAHTLIEYFSFPEEAKTACSQYLQYFYEFLKDIGIKAKVDLTEQDSGKVLFSVTPENKNEALENIRLALDIYLRLPSSKIETDMIDIMIQGLHAQILHLKSQLVLAAATIQQQQSTIQNLQVKSSSAEVLVLSQQSYEKDQESLLGEFIKVNEVELVNGSLTINLAALVRWLKQKIRKA